MTQLSSPLIETLVDLVEHKLLAMSSKQEERSADYRTLQDCRQALLVLAAQTDAGNAGARPAASGRRTAGHLTVITGDKA